MAGLRKASSGFTYLGVLLLVAFMGALLGSAGEVWHTVQRREAERDLRFIGEEFRRAIGRYYESTPGQAKRFPRKLEDLLQDNRYPGIRRYLRRIYRDPMTGRRDWGIVAAVDGGIAGIYSLSTDEPQGLQVPPGRGETGSIGSVSHDTLQAPTSAKEKKKPSYADWTFVYTPPPTSATPPTLPPARQPGIPPPPPAGVFR